MVKSSFRFKLTIAFVALLLGLAWEISGQEAGFKALEAEPPLLPCSVTFCKTAMTKVLIHDGKGLLVPEARSLEIKTAKLGEPFTVTCKIYTGLFEPTGATSKRWHLQEIRFVDEVEFQKLVDQGTSGAGIGTGPKVPGEEDKGLVPLIPGEAPVPAGKAKGNPIPRATTDPM